MKGTAHALTCIDSLPTAIRREINQLGGKYIEFPVTEIVVKQTFYAIIVLIQQSIVKISRNADSLLLRNLGLPGFLSSIYLCSPAKSKWTYA